MQHKISRSHKQIFATIRRRRIQKEMKRTTQRDCKYLLFILFFIVILFFDYYNINCKIKMSITTLHLGFFFHYRNKLIVDSSNRNNVLGRDEFVHILPRLAVDARAFVCATQ